MDVNGGQERRRMSRGETSPDRGRAPPKDGRRNAVAGGRRVQIVYYLCRKGQLEHPHFMEISYLPNQHPRLKDVLDRLTVLRGRGMPSLFAWSCKRSYKNGYVWNDLSENDVIYPAEGAEYILKGSEIIHGCDPTCSEKLRHLQLSRPSTFPAGGEAIETGEEEEEEEDEEGKHNGRHSIQPYNRCSGGVITDAKLVKELSKAHNPRHTEISLDSSSPPSSSSSDKAPGGSTGTSFRLEDGDPATEPGLSRGSVLLHLISCGSAAVKSAAAVSCDGVKRGGFRAAAEKHRVSRMPRPEEKEYFSGSIVEAIAESCRAETGPPSLKKSSSCNAERGAKMLEEDEEEGIAERGKCIPGRKRSSVKQGEQSRK